MTINGHQSIPSAYELKRLVALNKPPFWRSDLIVQLPTAPIYVFPDYDVFDSEDVARLSRSVADGNLRLPHSEVIYEVVDSKYQRSSLIYAAERDHVIHAFLFARIGERGQWTDTLCYARHKRDGSGSCAVNPKAPELKEADAFTLLHGTMLRATAMIMSNACTHEAHISRLRRSMLAKHGVSGWSYRVATIDIANIRALAEPAGGTHASPRWHIRRGHWRTLANGQRVFVRECAVGDQARGGVVKDYRIDLGSVA